MFEWYATHLSLEGREREETIVSFDLIKIWYFVINILRIIDKLWKTFITFELCLTFNKLKQMSKHFVWISCESSLRPNWEQNIRLFFVSILSIELTLSGVSYGIHILLFTIFLCNLKIKRVNLNHRDKQWEHRQSFWWSINSKRLMLLESMQWGLCLRKP